MTVLLESFPPFNLGNGDMGSYKGEIDMKFE
jgi:hypothetical protein